MKNELPVREINHHHGLKAGPGFPVRLLVTLAVVPLALYLLRPILAEFMRARAYSYAGLARQDDALRVAANALRLDEKNAGNWFTMANLLTNTGNDDDRALEAYRRGLAIQPENGGARFDLAMLHFWRREWAAAAEQLELVRREGMPAEKAPAELQIRYRATLMRLEHCYRELHMAEKAEDVAEEITRRFPPQVRDEPRP
ncbi:MAG: hypothetical protein HZA04_10765 [Nitrospinae bacterium]|nr:hypothetical protein [Nitrospinota bacterium]